MDRELDTLRIWTDLILPNDFTASITSYSLGVDKSNIKMITKEILLRAALLAEKGHDNPADHISGSFKQFHKDDINTRAAMILAEEREAQKAKKGKR